MNRALIAFAIPCVLLLGLTIWQLGWSAGPAGLPGRLVDYHKIYDGFWDVACDTAMDGSDRRCYIQYVDVYRPRPEFAAAMVEVVMHEGDGDVPDPHIRFDLEPGLSFLNTEIVIESQTGSIPIDVSHCAVNTCPISGDVARQILSHWHSASAITLEIREGRPEPARLSWPMENFDKIFEDFGAQRALRNLP